MVVYKNENETMRELILEETKEYFNTELKDTRIWHCALFG